MKSKINGVPVPTLKRLPLYLKIVKRMKSEGKAFVSCTDIAQECGSDAIQVRKDIASTGVVGQARVGFNVSQLIDTVENFLGWRNKNEAFLVGVGNLGTALLKYRQFKENGLNIVAAFETDNSKVGKKVDGVKVFNLTKLENLAERMHVQIGIIAVPGEYAQEIADRMIQGGIKALWVFSPVVLKVPDDVVVEYVLLSASLGVLTSKLNNQ